MNKYNYRQAVKSDIQHYLANIDLSDCTDEQQLRDKLNDDLLFSPIATANMEHPRLSDEEATEAVAHNWGLLEEALFESPEDYYSPYSGMWRVNPICEGVQWCDFTIRLYLTQLEIEAIISERFS